MQLSARIFTAGARHEPVRGRTEKIGDLKHLKNFARSSDLLGLIKQTLIPELIIVVPVERVDLPGRFKTVNDFTG